MERGRGLGPPGRWPASGSSAGGALTWAGQCPTGSDGYLTPQQVRSNKLSETRAIRAEVTSYRCCFSPSAWFVSILRSGLFLQPLKWIILSLNLMRAGLSHCHKGIKNSLFFLQKNFLISLRGAKTEDWEAGLTVLFMSYLKRQLLYALLLKFLLLVLNGLTIRYYLVALGKSCIRFDRCLTYHKS